MFRSGTFGEEKQSFDQNLSGVEGQGFDWNPPEPVGGKSLLNSVPFESSQHPPNLMAAPARVTTKLDKFPLVFREGSGTRNGTKKEEQRPQPMAPISPRRRPARTRAPLTAPRNSVQPRPKRFIVYAMERSAADLFSGRK